MAKMRDCLPRLSVDYGQSPSARVVRFFKSRTTATLFVYLVHWTGKGDDRFWAYHTREQIEKQTGLTRWQQKPACAYLTDPSRKFLSMERRRGSRRFHYHLNWPAIRRAWDEFLKTEPLEPDEVKAGESIPDEEPTDDTADEPS